MKRILCFFGIHKWESYITKDHDWTVENDEQTYEVGIECRRCNKKSAIRKLVVYPKITYGNKSKSNDIK